MRTGTRLVLALALATGCGWQAMGQAQDGDALRARQQALNAARAQQTAAPASPVGTGDELPVLSVRFAGGTIAEYVKTLRDASPLANIVVTPEAAGVVLPEIILQDVDLLTAASAVESREDLGNGRYRMVGVQSIGQWRPGRSANAFKIHAESGTSRVDRGQSASSASAWSLSALVSSGYSAEQILAAIQVGQTLFDEPAVIKYHETTKLLVARASNDQLSLISQTLAQLRQNQPASDAEAGIRNEIARKQEWLASTTQELETIQVRLVQVRREIAADDAPLPGTRRLAIEARARLETELRELERRVEELLQSKRNAEVGIRQDEMRLEAARRRQ